MFASNALHIASSVPNRQLVEYFDIFQHLTLDIFRFKKVLNCAKNCTVPGLVCNSLRILLVICITFSALFYGLLPIRTRTAL
jgi:hypothetical protein